MRNNCLRSLYIILNVLSSKTNLIYIQYPFNRPKKTLLIKGQWQQIFLLSVFIKLTNGILNFIFLYITPKQNCVSTRY